jgi:hypothetical protein
MSPNIRACNNHTFSGYSSHTKSTTNITAITSVTSCATGHSCCIGSIGTATALTSISQTTTTRSTSLAYPLNIRSMTHTHSYIGISVSQSYSSSYANIITCDSGHSECVMSTAPYIYYPIFGDITVTTASRTQSFTPTAPVNIKRRIHQHSLPNALLSWSASYQPYYPSTTSCGTGHSNCVGTDRSDILCYRVTTTSSTTSLN